MRLITTVLMVAAVLLFVSCTPQVVCPTAPTVPRPLVTSGPGPGIISNNSGN
jgi:hypothetical protein